ncbi:unnamed protein product, partial [Staurois parvus]
MSFSNFPPFRPLYVPTLAGDGTQMTNAGIRWSTLQGTLQEGHRGSAGQGKCRRDPRAVLQGIPECSLGFPLVVLKLYPELHSGIPPGRLIFLK